MKKSSISIIVIAVIYLLLHFIFVYWKRPMNIISSDTKEYYVYLPAVFINHDISLKYIEKDPKFFADKIWAKKLENGNYSVKKQWDFRLCICHFLQ